MDVCEIIRKKIQIIKEEGAWLTFTDPLSAEQAAGDHILLELKLNSSNNQLL